MPTERQSIAEADIAMNETIATLLRHRSIRKFHDEPIPDADIRSAIEAGQAASTSSAVQAYSLMRITDPEKREKLIELTGGQTKVARAPAFFIVCGDARRHQLLCEREGDSYQPNLETFLLTVIDASLFAQNLCVAFESMGYGICYIGGLRNDLPGVDALLDLPEGVYPLYGLCVGKPADEPMARPRLPIDAVYFEDAYPEDDEMLDRVDRYDEAYRAYQGKRGSPKSGWGPQMAAKYAQPHRAGLAAYYAFKGASLD